MISVPDAAGHAFPKWVERLEAKKGFDHTVYGISACECKWNSISNLKNDLKQGVLGDIESEQKAFTHWGWDNAWTRAF